MYNRSLRRSCGPLLLFALSSITFTACKDLAHVSKFSTAAAEHIAASEKVDYSVTKACLAKCEGEAVARLQMDFDGKCPCTEHAKSDSVRLVLQHVAATYFAGLGDLAADELTSFDLAPLSEALADDAFGITDERLKAGTQLATIVTRAFTDNYRRRKIKRYVAEAEPAVQVVLDGLVEFNNTKLAALEAEVGRRQATFLAIIEDERNSPYDRMSALQDHLTEKDRLVRVRSALRTYGEGLKKIKQGHQQLRKDLDRLKADDVRRALAKFYADITAVRTALNEF